MSGMLRVLPVCCVLLSTDGNPAPVVLELTGEREWLVGPTWYKASTLADIDGDGKLDLVLFHGLQA